MLKSESIKELAAALAKAQGQMEGAKKDAANPFFKSKYADLASVVEAIKKPLSDNGLAYTQLTDTEPDGVYIETVLMHTSGEWILGRLRMPVTKENDPQALGSAITYCRRYGLQSLIGVPSEDDDGNAANQGKGIIRATDGAADRISEAQRRKVEGVAEAMRGKIMARQWREAVQEYESAALDNESMIFLWSLFPASKDRSALKAAKEEMKKQAT